MTDQNTRNAPAFLDLGAKAGKELATMSRSGDKGEALAIVALVAARTSGYEMEYTTQRTKDESDTPVNFTLTTYGNNIVSENGKNDSKAISARKSALYADLFGLATFTPAQDSVIARAMVSAEYLASNGCEPTVDGRGRLVVPYQLVRSLAVDASDNAKTVHEAMTGKPVVLDGSKGSSLRELRNRAIAAKPKATRKARTATSNTEQDMRGAIKLLMAIVQTANNSDECPVAFKDDDLNMLNMLAAGIATLTGEDDSASQRKVA